MKTINKNGIKYPWVWIISALLLMMPLVTMSQENLEAEKKALEAEKKAMQAEKMAMEAEKRAMMAEKKAMHAEKGTISRKEQIEARKIAFMTKHLDLTPDEAKTFWPVFNQYEAEQKKLHEARKKELIKVRKNWDSVSDKDIEKLVDGEIIHAQKALDLKKKYHAEFKKILKIKKVAKLYSAEDQFKKHLLKELSQRKRSHMQQRRPMQQRPQR